LHKLDRFRAWMVYIGRYPIGRAYCGRPASSPRRQIRALAIKQNRVKTRKSPRPATRTIWLKYATDICRVWISLKHPYPGRNGGSFCSANPRHHAGDNLVFNPRRIVHVKAGRRSSGVFCYSLFQLNAIRRIGNYGVDLANANMRQHVQTIPTRKAAGADGRPVGCQVIASQSGRSCPRSRRWPCRSNPRRGTFRRWP
jgi:hypothetical protein